MTSDDAKIVLEIGLLAVSGIGTLFIILVKRTVRDTDQRVSDIAADLRHIAGRVTEHGESLAAGRVRFEALETRLRGLEDRERDRGCFSDCKVERGG